MSAGWSYKSPTLIAGFESQNTLTPPFSLGAGGAGTAFAVDTTTFFSGAASVQITNGSGTADYRYATLALAVLGAPQTNAVSCTMGMRVSSGLASGSIATVFADGAFGIAFDGLAYHNDGGSVKIAWI